MRACSDIPVCTGIPSQDKNGRFFYTIFPFGSVGRDVWAEKFKTLFTKTQFDVEFMYSAVDGNAVRVVFALVNRRNPNISPHGVGTLIQKRFTHDAGKGFAPVLTLDEATFVIVIAHIARYRVTTEPHMDVFNPKNPMIGDVGSCLAATVVEWVRFTSCRMMLDGLQQDLQTPDLRDRIRSWNEGHCLYHEIPFRYDMEDGKYWNSKDKLADSVSAIFQVGFDFCLGSVGIY
jgi:hypothetical protein